MFRKLLNVGKGHSNDRLQQQQQQQQHQKNLFQLNEIKSYGFSHFSCLGYSNTLSLLAVGSKSGQLRVFGNPSVEFSHQIEAGNAIRQIEFIDCRDASSKENKQPLENGQQLSDSSLSSSNTSAKLVVLTDNGQLHLFELKTIKQSNFADNTTQTDGSAASDCCQSKQLINNGNNNQAQQNSSSNALEYTKLEYVGLLQYFTHKIDDEDRSKRVTTLEISIDCKIIFVGTEGGNLYQVPLEKFEPIKQVHTSKPVVGIQRETGIRPILEDKAQEDSNANNVDEETTAVNLNDEPHIEQEDSEPFEIVKFEEDVANHLGDEVKPRKQGAIESIKKHPASNDKLLISYHRGLSAIYDIKNKAVDKYFYHNQILESSCFAGSQTGDFFYTSHNDGSYIKWDTRKGSQSKPDDDFFGQLYGPYPCKPTPKILASTGLLNDQVEDLIVFSGGMPRATYDDKNPVTIVRVEPDGKDTIKTVLDFTSKILDFAIITRPRGNLGIGAKSTGGGGKKNKNKQQQQQQQRNQPIAVALAILAEEEFAIIDLLNSESYLEFPLPYLNCVQPSAITCNQHYSDISDELYKQISTFNEQQLRGKYSQNEWPITGGKVIEAPEIKSHDILLTGHEDGSINIWDVSNLSMRHLIHLPTTRFFSTEDDDLVPIDDQQESTNDDSPNNESTNQQGDNAWPPLKRIGRFDPYSDDTRLAIRKLSLCPKTGTLLVAGTGGQVLVFELKQEPSRLGALKADEITIVADQRFAWKGRAKLQVRSGLVHQFEPGYQLSSFVQLNPPAAATSTDLRSDWRLFAVGTSYGFVLYDYVAKQVVAIKCTLNVQDFAIVSGDAGAMSRKKSFRKSLRESFRRLRRGRSQRAQASPGALASSSLPPAVQQHNSSSSGATSPDGTGAAPAPAKPSGGQFGRASTGPIRALNSAAPLAVPANDTAQQAAAAHRNLHSGERQVEPKVELSSIVKCISLTSAVITSNLSLFKPSLWIGTNSGQVLVYAIELASEQQQQPTRPSVASSADQLALSGGADAAPSSSSGDPAAAASQQPSSEPGAEQVGAKSGARLVKEIQLKHRAPIIAIFTSPEAPAAHGDQQQQSQQLQLSSSADTSAKSTPEKQQAGELFGSAAASGHAAGRKSPTAESEANEAQQLHQSAAVDKLSPGKKDPSSPLQLQQPRVLICSEEQFKVFNLPNLKPFCKFKLTAHEGLRAKKISITQFLKPSGAHLAASKQPSGLLVASASSITLSKSAAATATAAHSFAATQTSPPSSPVPAPDEPAAGAKAEQQQQQQQQTANGASSDSPRQQQQQQKQTAESNNNSLLALNNNHTQQASGRQQAELLNAKFGAKANNAPPVASTSNTANDLNAEQQQQQLEGATLEPYMICMSNQGDCAIYSVPDLKRQAQIQVCKREDVNGITSAMLTNYGEGYYLKSSSNFLRFSISSQRVLRVLSVV